MRRSTLALGFLLVLSPRLAADALPPSFTYQGVLRKSGVLVSATCTFQFSVWDQSVGGVMFGSQSLPVSVGNGLFTVVLNSGGEMGNPFTGEARWLDIGVQCPPDIAPTPLGRVAATSHPYALGLIPGATVSGPTGAPMVTGLSPSIQGTGLLGAADSGASAWGVAAFSTEGLGLFAKSDGTGTAVFAKAADNTSTPNTALQLEGGALRVSGTVKPAFIFTTSVVSSGCASMANPLLDGNSDAIVMLTPRQDTGTVPATDVRALYNSGTWYVCSPSLGTGMKYDVLVINQ